MLKKSVQNGKHEGFYSSSKSFNVRGFFYPLYSFLFLYNNSKKVFKTENPEDSIVLAMGVSIQSELWTLKNFFRVHLNLERA